ncbi:MAG TPA: peptide-N-glycosidase F-related protein [Polyangiaceae bacterium]
MILRRAVVLLSVSCTYLACSSGNDDGNGPTPVTDAGPAAPFTTTLLDNAHIGSDSSAADFQKATAPVTLTGGPFAEVKLVVDLASPCFPFSNWTSDPPPSGQNWPADCDAFDRNFEMALLDPANASAPGIELVRAITPFGGPEHVEEDVTDVFNAPIGARTFQVTIPTYSDSAGKVSGSKGGWLVSAHLEVTPGPAPHTVLGVTSLTYDSYDNSKSGTPVSLPFTVPTGTTSSRIEYRVTGHGGETDSTCNGPADEFCRRTHTLTLDDAPLATEIPYVSCKTNCTTSTDKGPFGSTYCEQNPCASPASAVAPRANWCPGHETPPFVYEPTLAPGDHTFAFAISKITGNWRVSATVFSYGD